jgi:hypothetical protein
MFALALKESAGIASRGICAPNPPVSVASPFSMSGFGGWVFGIVGAVVGVALAEVREVVARRAARDREATDRKRGPTPST